MTDSGFAALEFLAAVWREIWREQGLVTSRRAADVRKLRPALRDGITYAICHRA